MSTIRTDNLSNSAGTSTVTMNTVVNGSAKAWVNFNGTGTVAIRAAFNVSSITDNGTGVYTVNFSSAMSDTNYCVACCGSPATNNDSGIWNITSTTTTSMSFRNGSDDGPVGDLSIACATVFR